MNPIIAAAATVTAIGTIGSGALYLNEVHVPVAEFEKYLKAQETRYALDLKKEIRQVKEALEEHPDDEYLNEHLIDLIDALCEIRPDEVVCAGESP